MWNDDIAYRLGALLTEPTSREIQNRLREIAIAIAESETTSPVAWQDFKSQTTLKKPSVAIFATKANEMLDWAETLENNGAKADVAIRIHGICWNIVVRYPAFLNQLSPIAARTYTAFVTAFNALRYHDEQVTIVDSILLDNQYPAMSLISQQAIVWKPELDKTTASLEAKKSATAPQKNDV